MSSKGLMKYEPEYVGRKQFCLIMNIVQKWDFARRRGLKYRKEPKWGLFKQIKVASGPNCGG